MPIVLGAAWLFRGATGQAQFPPPAPAHLGNKAGRLGWQDLLLFGFGWTLLLEWIIRQRSVRLIFRKGHKPFAAAFESVTPRTAGLNTIDLGALTLPSQARYVPAHVHRRLARPDSRHQDRDRRPLVLTAISALCGRTTVSAFGQTICAA